MIRNRFAVLGAAGLLALASAIVAFQPTALRADDNPVSATTNAAGEIAEGAGNVAGDAAVGAGNIAGEIAGPIPKAAGEVAGSAAEAAGTVAKKTLKFTADVLDSIF
ncbi:MAG: hypothetical protein ACREE7_15625 [Dongiaceae bacterium]